MNKLIILSICWFTFACGVKGDPKPPFKPAQIGRGKPSFSGATKAIAKGLDKKTTKKKKMKEQNNKDITNE